MDLVPADASAKIETNANLGYDPDLERMRMQMEQQRWEAELEFRKQQFEEEKFQREQLKLQHDRELDLKERELAMRNESEREKLDEIKRNRLEKESDVYKAKMFSQALSGNLVSMPKDSIELISFFRNVEKLFDDFKVDNKLMAHLLKPHLTPEAQTLVSKMDSDKSTNYEAIKSDVDS